MPTILVVDDDPKIHHLMQRIAQDMQDWVFLAAETGRTGVQAIERHPAGIDAVLLDIALPEVDGTWVCSRIRSLCPQLPIIPFTALRDMVPLLEQQFSCAPALIKPVPIKEIVWALQNAMSASEGARIEERSRTDLWERVALPGSERTERRVVAGARLDDLNINCVRDHIANAIKLRGYDGSTNPLEYLLRHGGVVESAAGSFVPALVGVLAFATEPERFIDAAGVDIAQFSGPHPHSTALVFSKQVRGSILQQIDRTVETLWARSAHRYHLLGTERVEEHAYPLVVLRELTVNALCHRDWSYSGSVVRIQMFPTHIEWITPGGLPSGVTINNLRTAQVSRNPALAQILYHKGKVEKFGMGIDIVLDTLNDSGCEPPSFQDDGYFFTFRVWSNPRCVESLSDPAGLFNQRQSLILRLVQQSGSVTLRELEAALPGVTRRTIQRDLQELVNRSLLIGTGAANNRSYRLGLLPDHHCVQQVIE